MKTKTKLYAAVALASAAITPAHAITVTASNDAAALAAAIVGPDVTISSPMLTFTGSPTQNPTGTFTGGASSVGFDTGIVLTTGAISCVGGPNNQSSCTGNGISSLLSFNFTSATGNVFFSYVFGSEEYTQFVGSIFNDRFELRLDGTNIAQVPSPGSGVVSINNVNCTSNPAFYRNNVNIANGAEANNTCASLGLDTQYDGLTTVLVASALNIGAGSHLFEFFVTDIGDANLDSGVFIQGGSFSGTLPPPPGPGPIGVPEPSSLALAGLGLALAALRRRKHA